jgi:hypothetical protein
VETIPNGTTDDRRGHLGKLDEQSHGLELKANSILTRKGQGTNIDYVNSTHWAVGSHQNWTLTQRPQVTESNRQLELRRRQLQTQMQTQHSQQSRERLGEMPPPLPDPGQELAITARSSSEPKYVEGFENKHGAPTVGVQWHPEAYLVEGNARRNATPQAINQAETLFKNFGQATRAYAGRKQVNEEIRQRVLKAKRFNK